MFAQLKNQRSCACKNKHINFRLAAIYSSVNETFLKLTAFDLFFPITLSEIENLSPAHFSPGHLPGMA
jgi:hypothetical protein